MSAGKVLRRLARMSWHEIWTRGRQAAAKRTDVLYHRFGMASFRTTADGSRRLGKFFCDTSAVPAITEIIRRRMPDEARAIVAEADAVLNGRFRLLGYQNLGFGDDIDWSLDPVHARSLPLAPWPSIPYLNFDVAGDHKVIWELSRHQFLVTLARAYRITGEEHYAGAARELWQDWQRKNPYPLGVNWASTLEVAYRALSWMWTAFLLEGTAAGTPEFQSDIARETERAGLYIDRYLSTYFSPNTHLLGEAVVLFLIACRYPGLRHAARWRDSVWAVIDQACTTQVRPDGFYFEQSTYYHVYALDLFLCARLTAARNGIAIPELLDATIRRMSSAIAELSVAGVLPRYGDDDGGRLFDSSRNSPAQMLDPLPVTAVLYRDAAVKSASAGLTEETLWLLGPESERVFDSLPSAPPAVRSTALKESGFYSLVGPGESPAQLFVDAGEQGSLAAGHGHADALSVQLAWRGRLWLVDPGTCWYLGPDSRRTEFRGTAAHNTVTVDGRDQADPATPFSWGILPVTRTEEWVTGNGFDLYHGQHTGYQRLDAPVTHHRWVVRAGESLWLVRDVLTGQGEHEIGVHWHFHPDLNVTATGSRVIASDGSHTLTLVSDRVCAVEAGEYSPVYGQCIPAPVARTRFRSECPAETAAAIALDAPAPDATLRLLQNEPIVYEYVCGGDRKLFCFGTGGGPWTFEGWETDAAFLCIAGSKVLAAVGSSYVRQPSAWLS